jgi:protein-tyrosine phosphatase
MIRLCFVCLGNICRSPTAESVMRHLVQEAGLAHAISVESAGTAGYHAGEPADRRSRAAARRRGISMDGCARQFVARDFERFDYVLAMDPENLANLRALGPPHEQGKLHLLRAFDPAAPRNAAVPDPYYGGGDGFEEVLDLCDAACRGLLAHIQSEHHL